MGTRIVTPLRIRTTEIENWTAVLFAMLSDHPLSPAFEDYGNFIITDAADLRLGEVTFWGNFWAYSVPFCIITDDPVLITRLVMAIRANQASPAYQEARKAQLADRELYRRNVEARARQEGA